jgi:predicted AAA+ superfamily ATPase
MNTHQKHFDNPQSRDHERQWVSTIFHFYDTGLATYLLGIKTAEQLAVHPHRGSIFETFIASEIMKSAFNGGATPSLYFWRDRSGNEIDFLIGRGSDLLPIEAKSGKTVAAD